MSKLTNEMVLSILKKDADIGVLTVDLKNDLGVDYCDLKPILNDLHQKKQITVKQGINGKLIYYKR